MMTENDFSGCEACMQLARETALENFVDDRGLRIDEWVGKIHYTVARELTFEEEAVIEQWALSLMEWAPRDCGWHELHQEYAR
jgi:hypothetical protein